MNTLRIAFRNILRNRRRSAVTLFALAVSATSLLLFGGFVLAIFYGMQTGIVQKAGHLHVYRTGFFEFGSANPSAYGIRDPEGVIRAMRDDSELGRLVRVATPILQVYGIASNSAAGASKPFFGAGVVPSDQNRMREWNEYGIRRGPAQPPALTDRDSEGAVIGYGLARMLELCEELHVPGCRKPAQAAAHGELPPDLAALPEVEQAERRPPPSDARPRLDLMGASARGAPNIVTVTITRAVNQGAKELDDSYVSMHLAAAQRLLYGRAEPQATGIILQLHRTASAPAARARLMELFRQRKLDLEVREFDELIPMYRQILSMFAFIFAFFAGIMGLIVLFTVASTMSMTVLERVDEIGTIRALGVRRGGILRQFLVEGTLLGALGSALGVAVGALAAWSINAGGITWTPPGSVAPVPLTILLFQMPLFAPAVWAGLTAMAALSSLLPARKASRMPIVDALRHV